jgi:hypothetical protein
VELNFPVLTTMTGVFIIQLNDVLPCAEVTAIEDGLTSAPTNTVIDCVAD